MLGLKHIFFECTIQSHKSYSALRNHRSFHQGFRDCSSSICLLPILPVAIWALHLWNIAIHLKMSEFSQMDTYFSRLLALGSELVEQHETSEKSAGIIVTMSQPHRELATSSDSCDQILETQRPNRSCIANGQWLWFEKHLHRGKILGLESM